MSEVVREFFDRDMLFKNPKDIVDVIIREHRKLHDLPFEQREERVKKVTKRIKNEICICSHPIVKKMIDWGEAKGKSEYARDFERVVRDLLNKGIKSAEDIRKVGEAVERFRRGLMKYVENRILRGRRGS